jgi:serine/threonine protein kinase/thiol-disulfide isomerase/thioredoxin
MIGQPTQSLNADPRVRALLDEYRAAAEAGEAPDPRAFLAQHMDLAPQLAPVLLGDDKAASWLETMAPPAQPQAGSSVPDANLATLDPADGAPGMTVPFRREFGDYELLEEIARGGMGVVFKARQKSLQRVVALKMILAGQLATPQQVRRFHMEAEEAGHLDHPNIVPIYQVGEIEGQHYFTMKLIEGGSLATHLARLQQDQQAAVRLVVAVARAVHHAHQRGILHRDLKPGNILLDAGGQPHVTDFGLAKHLASDGQETQSGAVVGTPAYMAPEQAAGRKDLSTAADVYGLGAVLYELLTGRPPFRAATPFDTIVQVMERDPIRPSAICPRVPRDLETICLSCLAKDPGRRYASSAALADDLERFLKNEPVHARPVGKMERLAKWARRRPAAAALVAVLVLAGLSLTIGGWWASGQLQSANQNLQSALTTADEQRREAERQRELADENAAEANRQRELAQQHAAEANRQGTLVKANYRERLDSLDDFLIRVDGRLANMSGTDSLRLEFLHNALNMSKTLLKEDETNPSARRQAARLHRCMGDLYGRSDRDEAEKAYREALGLLRQLVQEQGDKADFRDDLALTLAHRAEFLQAGRSFDKARADYTEAIGLLDRLAAEAPKKPAYRVRAARQSFDMGNLLEELGKPAEAEKVYRDTLARQEQLAKDYPQKADYHADLGRTAGTLATLLAETKPDEAERQLRRNLAAQRAAVRLAPGSKTYRLGLHEAYTVELVPFLERRGQHAALPALAVELRRDFVNDPESTYRAAGLIADAAKVAQADKKLPEPVRQRLAEDYGRQAVVMLGKAVKEGYTDRAGMEKDKHLDPIRSRPDYQAFLADLDKRLPMQPPTAAQEYANLLNDYDLASRWYDYYQRTARTVAEKKRAETRQPQFAEYAKQFIALAEKHRDTPTAVEALGWVLEMCPDDNGVVAPDDARMRDQAIAIMQREHFQAPELANVCQQLAGAPTPGCDELLRAALAKHARRDVRGLAGYALALSLASQAERAHKQGQKDAETLAQKAEQQLEQLAAEYASVPYGSTTLGETVKSKLYEQRFLSAGRPAADIEGEDLDGKRMKLSDYRGKVVVLDFWADWCGWCRQMYPQEKALVKKMNDRPFALLGINCDEAKADAVRAVQKEQLPWHSWWDFGQGGRRISDIWQVNSFPMVYVLDHKGVIRYKNVRGQQFDDAVEKLVKECEAERAKKGK